ncbi:MAG: hypothetical protein H7330_12675 [Hymenobacteraceae bacterium]|nr:hypothetical protein [Hymenobacteraceae bacterium]
MAPPPYFSYFQNAFLTLVISRPNFRGLAQYTLDAVRQGRATGRLGAEFDPLVVGLTDAIARFDHNLLQRNDPTAGNTEAFRQARAAWLAFVLEQQERVVKGALFGQAALKDFRPLTHNKLRVLGQETLLTKSDVLVKLYADYAATLQPLYAVFNPPLAGEPVVTLAKRAAALVKGLRAADSVRDQGDAQIHTSIKALATDWVALAVALRRVKGQLEVVFDTDQEVYDFFDFSKAKSPRSARGARK